MSSQVVDFVNWLLATAPHLQYDTSNAPCNGVPARCNPTCSGEADCSGFVNAGCDVVHCATPSRCMVSGQFYRWCQDANTLMTRQQAFLTYGALLFHGPAGLTHIAVSLGNGYQVAAHGEHFNPQVGVAPIGRPEIWTPMGGWVPGMRADQWPPIIVPPKDKVHPMYDPPLAKGLGIADSWQDSRGRVLAQVAPNGDVYAWAVPFRDWPTKAVDFHGREAARIGQANTFKPKVDNAANRQQVARMRTLPDTRYCIEATSGELYCP